MKSSRVQAACCDPKQIHPRHKKPQTYPLQWAACCPGAEPQTPPPAPASGILSLPSATAEEHPEQPGTWQGCRRLSWVGSGRVGAFSWCLGRSLDRCESSVTFVEEVVGLVQNSSLYKSTAEMLASSGTVWIFLACLLIFYISSIIPYFPQHLEGNFAYQRFVSEITATALNSFCCFPASLFLKWEVVAFHPNGGGIIWAITRSSLLIFKWF